MRKLGMTSRGTMSTAQQLYEGVDLGGSTVGLITYMRTDSFSLATEALHEIRDYIRKKFEPDYLPKAAILYRSKSKNAQEAHEAIRPTSVFRTPESIRQYLTPDQAALYEMIWKRTLACQMNPAKYDTTTVDISVGHADTLFRANGQILVFPGFMGVYLEDADDTEQEEDSRLPALEEQEAVPLDRVFGEQHFTQPPPRYTEASLVKTLEEYGIGRPSTYASIVSTLQDRGYALLEKKRFTPTNIGRMVNGFLTSHFDHYVDYRFTANLEEELDDISNGVLDWIAVMRVFWNGFSQELNNKEGIERGIPVPETDPRVIDWISFSKTMLDQEWQDKGRPVEKCPKCSKPVLLQNSSRGLFFGCSGYPQCDYTRPWGGVSPGPLELGIDPVSGLEVLLLKGPYGHYVQLGQTNKDAKEKPKRAAWTKSVPVPTEASAEAFALSLKLLSLPRQLGAHPETGKPVEANIGRFGPYVKHDGMFKSIPKAENVHEISLGRAVELLAEKKAAGGGGRPLGAHPEDKKTVAVYSGRYGPYVKHGKTNATIPASADPEKITLEEAVALLAAKSKKGSKSVKKVAAKAPTGSRKAPRKKTPAKKAPGVKAPGKKAPAVKEPAVKKPAGKSTKKKSTR